MPPVLQKISHGQTFSPGTAAIIDNFVPGLHVAQQRRNLRGLVLHLNHSFFIGNAVAERNPLPAANAERRIRRRINIKTFGLQLVQRRFPAFDIDSEICRRRLVQRFQQTIVPHFFIQPFRRFRFDIRRIYVFIVILQPLFFFRA